jgi:hypothetical protein
MTSIIYIASKMQALTHFPHMVQSSEIWGQLGGGGRCMIKLQLCREPPIDLCYQFWSPLTNIFSDKKIK